VSEQRKTLSSLLLIPLVHAGVTSASTTQLLRYEARPMDRMIWLSVAQRGEPMLRFDGMEDRRNAIGALLREYHARNVDPSAYFVESNVPHLTGIRCITSNDVRSLPHNWHRRRVLRTTETHTLHHCP
jgi:hypothetical protein